MKVPFSPPDMTEQEVQEVREAILSGWITTGPRTKKLEKLISSYVNTDKTVCLNSATASMEMVLHLLGIGPGDEIIVPVYTYTATASVAQHVGATLVMVDSQKDCVEMDYDQLEKAITERTKVIMPVDLGGIVADYDRVYEVVERKKHLFKPSNALQAKIGRIVVTADCAHSLGAWRMISQDRWNSECRLSSSSDGRCVTEEDDIKSQKVQKVMAGAIADFSSFSFHAVKNFTTAEGGAMTWNLPFGNLRVESSELNDYMPDVPFLVGETWNELLYRLAQLFSLHGQNKDAFAKTELGGWEYDIIGPWYKCNMTDIMAAIGLIQMERYPAMLERRQEMVARYDEAFANLPVAVLNHKDSNHCSSHHLYMVRLLGKSREETNRVMKQMAKRGIATNVHYKPLPMMTAYKALGFDIKNYQNAYHLFENEITLPLNTKMTDEMLQFVIDNFTEIIQEKKKVYLCLAHMSDAGEEMKYINRAFDENWVVPLGPNVDGFESDLEAFVNGTADGTEKQAKSVVALSSGTAAVHLGLLALGVGPGDEVLVQSFTFCASMNPIRYLGATPIIIDSESDTWNMDPALLEKAIQDRIAKIGKKPKAIVVVYLYGMPAKIDEIMDIAHRYDIPVLEDAAEAFGSRYKGRIVGTFGDYGVLSFNGNKMITTSGGGALICPSQEAKKRVMWYATQAREAYPYYQHEAIGYNYRLSNVCAGIGRGQMTVANAHIAHHRHIASLYEAAFRDVKGITYHKELDGIMLSNYWLSTIELSEDLRVKNEEQAYAHAVESAVGGAAGVVHRGGLLHTDCEPNRNVEALRISLQAVGIESRPLWKPMHKQPVFRDVPAYVNGVSEGIFNRGLCLPSGPMVTDEDVSLIIDTIKANII